MVARRPTEVASPDRHGAYSLSQESEQKVVLSRSGVLAHQRPAQFCQAVAANLFRPLADRSEPPRREGHCGGRASAVTQRYFRAQTTGLSGRRLQRSIAGIPAGLWRGAGKGLCRPPQVAPPRSTAILLGSHHAPAQGNGTTTATARSLRPHNHRSSLSSGCRRLRKCRNSRHRLKPVPPRLDELSHLPWHLWAHSRSRDRKYVALRMSAYAPTRRITTGRASSRVAKKFLERMRVCNSRSPRTSATGLPA